MGNAGLALALEAFERAGAHGAPPSPFRVEHLALAAPDQLDRLVALGVVGVVQPGFVPMLGPNVAHSIFDDADWLPFAAARDRGLEVAASTDAPCADWHPLAASCHGATRRYDGERTLQVEQAVDYRTWLRAWTAGGAFAGGQEAERGRLRVGLRADAVVLDGELDPDRPPRVHETWVGGERVHRAEPCP
jgi:predicted amidohydrolase YtcJ